MSRSVIAVFLLSAINLVHLQAAGPDDDQGAPTSSQWAASSVAAEPKKQNLDRWWDKSSLSFEPRLNQWLFQADGTFSFMNSAGNTSGTSVDTSGSVEVRKKRFTSHSFAQFSRKDLQYLTTHASVSYTEQTAREQLDFDLSSRMMLIGGIENYSNGLMFMDKRLSLYGGLAGTIYNSARHHVTMSAALGHTNFAFDEARLLSIAPDSAINMSPQSFGALATQSWRWNVSRRFIFNEDTSYMDYFQSHMGKRWTVNLNGTFPISRNFSFNVMYRVKDEENQVTNALNVLPQDRSLMVGIKVSAR